MKKFLFLLLLSFFASLSFVHADPLMISQSEVDTLMIGATIEGSRDATITLIEYSDMECPFCVRLHNDIALWKNIQAKYGSKVNYVFKNNRGVNHKNTEKKALSALCIKKIGGDKAYIAFYDEVLSASSTRLYPVARIPSFLRKQKIPTAQFQSCMKDPTTLSQYNAETNEAQKYDLGGTPGVIILNHKTLKYDTVLGAYPIETFEEKIDAILK